MPIVERCEVCNVRLPRVQREDTRYCGSTCRVRASRARRKGRSRADLMRRFAWSRTPTDTRSWVVLWYRRLAHGPLRALAAQRREAQALRMQLGEAQATIQRQAADLAQLRQQLAALAEQSDRESASSLAVRSERNALEARERTTAAELDETRTRLKRSAEDAENARVALRVERQRAAILGSELAVMREQSDVQSHRTAKLAAQLAGAEEERGQRRAQLAALARRLEGADRALDRTTAEARTARAERDTAQVRALTAEAALEKTQWLLHIKSCEADENRNQGDRAQRRVMRLRQKLAQARATSAQRRKRAAALDAKLAKAKEDTALRQAEHEKQMKEATERLTVEREQAVQAVRNEAEAESVNQELRLALIREVCSQSLAKNDALEKEVRAASQNKDMLASLLSAVSEECTKAQQALASYKSATEKELAELRAYRQRTQEPTEELKDAKKEICQLKGAVISAQNKRDEAKRVLEIGRGNWESWERNLQEQISKLKEQVRTLTEERDRGRGQPAQVRTGVAPSRGR